MERKQQLQIGAMAGCLLIGAAIVVALVSTNTSPRGRVIVVDPNAKPATQPSTTRAATTRPLMAKFMQAMAKPNRDVAIEMLKADPKLATVEVLADGFSTPLHYAAAHDDRELVDLLLADGADLNAVENRHNGTPLEWAAYEGQVKMVKYLLYRGAIVDDPAREIAAQGARGDIYWKNIPKATQKATYGEIAKLLNGPRPTTFATTGPATRG